jgi:heme/copper-type cytochrome/quinol oxidase subunit 3
MNKNGSNWYNIAVGVLCFGAFVLLFLMLRRGLLSNDATINLPILVITGVMALFATLALVAVTFSVAGLSDETQALGLPEGSVRAAIALSLIVIFAITSIYLYSSMSELPTDSPSVDFAKQVFTVVGTLMTSVTSFYFATRAAASTAKPTGSTPTLTSITPTMASKAATPVVSASIFGTGLQLTKGVNLEMGGKKVPGTNVLSNDQLIKCDFMIDPGPAVGKYDVVVTSTDGTTATLSGVFDLQP